MQKKLRYINRVILVTLLLSLGPLLVFASGKTVVGGDWRNANRESSNIAPKPAEHSDAVIQIYSARTFSWRGLFASHTWIATKNKNEQNYTVYQVIGWRGLWKLPVLSIQKDVPDRYWFGQRPTVIKSFYGAEAEKLIPKIEQAAASYPYKEKYILWPGPNSNTFTAFIARQIPELQLSLPSIAIGKDFLGKNKFFAKAPSGTGYQFSFYGIFGILLARDEGLEINIIGLVFGINPLKLSITLPGLGSFGLHLANSQTVYN